MAINYGSISALATSLKTAADVTKAMVGLRDATLLQSKVIELQGVILSAQSAALSAQSDQFTLLERVRQLEKEMADVKAWDAEKQKYELREVSYGVFAYTLKKDTDTTEPPHWLCTACYQHGDKSFLQFQKRIAGDKIFQCPKCKALVAAQWSHGPGEELHRSGS